WRISSSRPSCHPQGCLNRVPGGEGMRQRKNAAAHVGWSAHLGRKWTLWGRGGAAQGSTQDPRTHACLPSSSSLGVGGGPGR
ncbi:hypothetical protein XENOCAPTIV_025317, partial [Xenoophorus captivus]